MSLPLLARRGGCRFPAPGFGHAPGREEFVQGWLRLGMLVGQVARGLARRVTEHLYLIARRVGSSSFDSCPAFKTSSSICTGEPASASPCKALPLCHSPKNPQALRKPAQKPRKEVDVAKVQEELRKHPVLICDHVGT